MIKWNYENYSEWQRRKSQIFVQEAVDEIDKPKVEYEQPEIMSFCREPRPELVLIPQETLAFALLSYQQRWEDMDHPLVVLEKIAANLYLDSLNIDLGRWSVGYGVYCCSLCSKSSMKDKLRKVIHLDHICEECASKYQTQIMEVLARADLLKRLNSSKRK